MQMLKLKYAIYEKGTFNIKINPGRYLQIVKISKWGTKCIVREINLIEGCKLHRVDIDDLLISIDDNRVDVEEYMFKLLRSRGFNV